MSAQQESPTDTRPVPAYAVVYEPKPDGWWRATLVDFPEITVTASTFGVAKARITEAGRRAFEEAMQGGAALPRPKAVVGYAYLDKSDRVCRLDAPVPGLF